MKKLVALFTVLLGCIYLTTAYAEVIMPYSDEDRVLSCSLTSNGTQLTAKARISTPKSADRLEITKICIQEYKNGKWVTVHTEPSLSKTNVSRLTNSTTYNGKSGSKYRAVASFSSTVDGVTRAGSATSSSRQL